MTDTFTIAVSYGSTMTNKARIKVAQFGDGYEQRVRDGINTSPRSWNVQFNQRSTDEADAIEAFFAATGCADYFYWTPPTGAAGKWVVRPGYSRTRQAGNTESINAVFDEVFEP